jgi:hypothetical protein
MELVSFPRHLEEFLNTDVESTSTSSVDYSSLQWYAIQTIFEQAKSDVLLLLDCCAAASGAPAEGHCTSLTETIAACGFETVSLILALPLGYRKSDLQVQLR